VVFQKLQSSTAEKIESALQSHLAGIHFSIAKTAVNAVLDAYYIRFLIWNLKLILKGKILDKSQNEIESYLNSTGIWHAFCYTGSFRQSLKVAFENNVLIYI